MPPQKASSPNVSKRKVCLALRQQCAAISLCKKVEGGNSFSRLQNRPQIESKDLTGLRIPGQAFGWKSFFIWCISSHNDKMRWRVSMYSDIAGSEEGLNTALRKSKINVILIIVQFIMGVCDLGHSIRIIVEGILRSIIRIWPRSSLTSPFASKSFKILLITSLTVPARSPADMGGVDRCSSGNEQPG